MPRPVQLVCLLACAGLLTMAAEPAPNMFDQMFEKEYMKGGMIDHHFAAAEMGKICLQKNVRWQLKSMCQNIVTTQTSEVQKMQMWLAEWYGIQYSPMLDEPARMTIQKLSALNGQAFEKEFLKHMVIHHWTAIPPSARCVDRAWHDPLNKMCQEIIKSQVKEIEQMQAWLCSWFSLCDWRPKGRELPPPPM